MSKSEELKPNPEVQFGFGLGTEIEVALTGDMQQVLHPDVLLSQEDGEKTSQIPVPEGSLTTAGQLGLEESEASRPAPNQGRVPVDNEVARAVGFDNFDWSTNQPVVKGDTNNGGAK